MYNNNDATDNTNYAYMCVYIYIYIWQIPQTSLN